MNSQPRFQHDCQGCRFVARVAGYDLYVCHPSHQRYPTYIARYGNEGPNYSSCSDWPREYVEEGIGQLVRRVKRTMREQIQRETGGLAGREKELDILTTFRLLPCLLLNEPAWNYAEQESN